MTDLFELIAPLIAYPSLSEPSPARRPKAAGGEDNKHPIQARYTADSGVLVRLCAFLLPKRQRVNTYGSRSRRRGPRTMARCSLKLVRIKAQIRKETSEQEKA